MAGIRIVATITYASADEAQQVAERLVKFFEPCRSEDGVVQYELFRSVENPEKLVLQEHWASFRQYDNHWRAQTESGKNPDLGNMTAFEIEFYQHQNFDLVDNVWVPANPDSRISTIRWS